MDPVLILLTIILLGVIAALCYDRACAATRIGHLEQANRELQQVADTHSDRVVELNTARTSAAARATAEQRSLHIANLRMRGKLANDTSCPSTRSSTVPSPRQKLTRSPGSATPASSTSCHHHIEKLSNVPSPTPGSSATPTAYGASS